MATVLTNRTRFDIDREILGLLSREGQTKKTRIMYQVGLSFAQIQKYLPRLIEQGKIVFDAANETYRITAKGATTLQNLNVLNEKGASS